MPKITFISTMHKEAGKCNAYELYKIIEAIKPEVIFLEAYKETYSAYERHLFLNFQVYNMKVELAAIQKYGQTHTFAYVPVCENYFSEAFEQKNQLVCQNIEWQWLMEDFIARATTYGFGFLNSSDCENLQEKMRLLESQILEACELYKIVKDEIEAYENPMMDNIYSYCRENPFDTAIFMVGAAHRKSIIEKIVQFNRERKIAIDWRVYGS